MTPNSQEIVQQIKDKFEEIIIFVTQNQQDPPSIYQAEKHLLASLLSLGRDLMLAFIITQQERIKHIDRICLNGKSLPIHSLKRRSYRSIFGKIKFKRFYYYKSGQSYFLLDAKIKMPENTLSDLLREWISKTACYLPYHKTGEIFEDILTQKLSCRPLEEIISEDSTLVEEFYQNNPVVSPATEAKILVAQADGKGIPMLPENSQPIRVRLGKGEKLGQKKEAIVTSVYTIAPFVRTPEEVTISLFKENKNQENKNYEKSKKRSGPQNKQLWATLEGKKSALEFTAKQVSLREGEHISMRVALTDGSAPLQEKMLTHLPLFSLVLDIIHAVEYLWEAGNSLYGEKSPLRQVWVQKRVLLLLQGQSAAVISDLRGLAAAPSCKKTTSEVLLKVANYYQRNASYMRYDDYLAAGWPIATGVIEGACRHLVKDRFELSGMHWRVTGAESLLRLRCVAENQDWESFHCLRREREQTRLYGTFSAWDSPCIERANNKMKMPQVGYQVA
jgi:hypothetical protein